MKKPRKPSPPRKIEAASPKDPATWGADSDALKRQVDVVVSKPANVVYARRAVWWEVVLKTKNRQGKFVPTPESNAFDRLSDLIATRRGEGDRPQGGYSDPNARELVNSAQLVAADAIYGILSFMTATDGAFVVELIDPRLMTTTAANEWRITVARYTRERNAHAQSAAVRYVARHLAAALAKFDSLTFAERPKPPKKIDA